MNDKIIVGTSQNFEEKIAGKTVLVDFWASWCGPCKMLSPVIDDVAGELAGSVTVIKVNVDEQEELSEKYQISTIPTLILIKNSVEAERMVGYKQKAQIIEFAKK